MSVVAASTCGLEALAGQLRHHADAEPVHPSIEAGTGIRVLTPIRGRVERVVAPDGGESRAESSTVLVNGPIWSSDEANAINPYRLTVPYVGFIPPHRTERRAV